MNGKEIVCALKGHSLSITIMAKTFDKGCEYLIWCSKCERRTILYLNQVDNSPDLKNVRIHCDKLKWAFGEEFPLPDKSEMEFRRIIS